MGWFSRIYTVGSASDPELDELQTFLTKIDDMKPVWELRNRDAHGQHLETQAGPYSIWLHLREPDYASITIQSVYTGEFYAKQHRRSYSRLAAYFRAIHDRICREIEQHSKRFRVESEARERAKQRELERQAQEKKRKFLDS